MKAVVAAFNQEKALVGVFSVITNLRMDLFEALVLHHNTGAQCACSHYHTSWAFADIMTTILSKRIKASVNFFLAVAFIIHISYIFYFIVYPTLPEIKNYKKQLNEIEFPIAFQLCVEERANSTKRYNQVGYSDAWTFFYGQSKFNSSIYGWAGHMENGSTFESTQGKLF